jgi:tetratricopeptide (TPR) repeat protein
MSRPNLENLRREARAALMRKDMKTAAELADEILRHRRQDFDALMIRADVANDAEHTEEEVGFIERAVRVQPKNGRLRAHLGRRHLALGALKRALTQFETALKLDKDNAEAIGGKATVLIAQNHYDRARRLLAPWIDGSPPPPIAAPALRVLVHDDDLDGAIALGRRVLDAGHPPTMPLSWTCFSLGKAYERNGDYPEAFAAVEQAHAIDSTPYDPEVRRRLVDDLIAAFPRARLDALPRPAEPSSIPIFVVGMPRSGSTLVERILHAHPKIKGVGELDALRPIVLGLPDAIGSSAFYPDCVPELEAAHVDAAAAAYLARVRKLAPGAERVADKYLSNYLHIGMIEVLFPTARVVHCRRNPLDNCLSCFMEPLRSSQAPFAGDLASLGHYYREYRRLMAHWRSVIEVPMLDLDYETMVDDQEGTSRRLIEFCGLPWDDACLEFHTVRKVDQTISFDQVRRPIYRSALGRAERFGALLDPLRAALGDADDV